MVKMDGLLLEDYPFAEFRSSYKAILRNITSLELKGIATDYRRNYYPVLEILSYCKNLKNLRLAELNGVGPTGLDTLKKLPSKLTTFQFEDVRICPNLLSNWCCLLNPTLRTFKLRGPNIDSFDLTNLYQIRTFEVEVDCEETNDELWSFLLQNKDTLQELHIECSNRMCSFADFDKISVVLPQLVNLKKFTTRCFNPNNPFDLSGLPYLEEIGVDYRASVIVNTDNIKKLVVQDSFCTYDESEQNDHRRYNQIQEHRGTRNNYGTEEL